MGYKKVAKELKKYALEEYTQGHDDGFSRGVEAERARTIGLFRMFMETELESGSGVRAKFWKEAGDVVNIANELEVFDEEGESLDHGF